MDKPMTLPTHECRDKFFRTRRVLPPCAGVPAVVHGAAARITGRLRRCAVAQYSRLVFSVLDGLRVGGHCLGNRSPRNFQSLGPARGDPRALRRDGGDYLCRHVRDVADMAVLRNADE
jgi:hypothetical protein